MTGFGWVYSAEVPTPQQLASREMRGQALPWDYQEGGKKEMSFERSLCKMVFSAGTFEERLVRRAHRMSPS